MLSLFLKTLLVIIPLAGGVANASTTTITHHEGTSQVPNNPRRIVALDEESVGWLAALGLQDRIVGVGSSYLTPQDVHNGYIKPEVLSRGFYGKVRLRNPAYVGNWVTPNFEAIAALKPDLIVRLTWDGNQNYDKLSKLAPVIGYKEGGEGFWQKNIRDLGKTFGLQLRAENIIKQTNDVGRNNLRKIANSGILKKYPKAIVLAPFTGGNNWLYTNTRLVPEVNKLGFRNGIIPKESITGVGYQISDEALAKVSKNTLVILFPPGGKYNGIEAFLKTPVGQRLKDQSIIYIPDDFNPYTGPLMSTYHSNKLTELILALPTGTEVK